ncbi:MAG TPA: DUF1634 domain-containing protein [Opitutus sp.]|nr:DUF1634 domain-containing protein [Opitutus sp.]
MKPELDDASRRDRIIAALLRRGTWCASFLIAAGMLWSMAWPSVAVRAGLDGYGLMRGGVALFILLPVARVAVMLAVFVRERDRAYTLISALVLAVIATGLAIGLLL